MAAKRSDPNVVITGAHVYTGDGRLAATIDLVEVGGGSQTVTVDGVPEERVHDKGVLFHVRFQAPDRFLPDELREASSYGEAVGLATAYAAKLDEHADQIAKLADSLKV